VRKRPADHEPAFRISFMAFRGERAILFAMDSTWLDLRKTSERSLSPARVQPAGGRAPLARVHGARRVARDRASLIVAPEAFVHDGR
jgi:hypothetical protein